MVIIDYHQPKPTQVIADLDQQILKTEGSGVLNWMLEGLHKLRADGWQLNLNAAQQSKVDNLLLESDGHTIFVKHELGRADNADLKPFPRVLLPASSIALIAVGPCYHAISSGN